MPESTALVRPSGFANDWDERARIAKVAANTELVPKSYRGKFEDTLIAMQYGAEIGLPPLAAVNGIVVVNGRPTAYGDAFLGVVMAAPTYEGHSEYYETANGKTSSLSKVDYLDDETRAVAIFKRRGVAEPFVAEFSIADAKRANLWNKDGPWRTFPARMLRWRAREFAARDAFAPELRGITITEVAQAEADIIEAPPIVAPVRRSERLAGAPGAAGPDAQPTTDRAAEARQAPATPVVEASQAPPEPIEPDPFGEALAPDAGPDALTAQKAPPRLPPMPPMKPRNVTVGAPPMATAADSVVITDTAFVQKKDEDSYYEIRVRVVKEGEPPTGYILLTRDKSLYDLAASAEGSTQTYAITWRNARRPDGSACKVLESIEAS